MPDIPNLIAIKSDIESDVSTPYLLATIQLDHINKTVVAQIVPTSLSFSLK